MQAAKLAHAARSPRFYSCVRDRRISRSPVTLVTCLVSSEGEAFFPLSVPLKHLKLYGMGLVTHRPTAPSSCTLSVLRAASSDKLAPRESSILLSDPP